MTAKSDSFNSYDFLDILEAPNEETAFKMAAVILSSGMGSSVETWTALSYQKVVELTRSI